ncbi:5-formyltetrahydrofolate cyclo-ligase [Myxosarcina sp. GI1]|uniref:5-formyltetrahydrofolate cyclo-ligase n=1 Tax=Myxosarcina sp. GI1 TaxID=1541065 RepID=UPI00055B56C9|nr:5-formyltetrahydrofolate cyclo-ligase [Myxosarcina sp. GI1]
MSQLDKIALRRDLLTKRRALSIEEWQQKSLAICDRLQAWSLFTEANTVLAYFSFRQEPNLELLFSTPKRWGFPRCEQASLIWHWWQPGETLFKGKYGIQEPLIDAPLVEPSEVDLILVPTVACDRQGYRLGYGGGFYDRLLSSPQWSQIPTIGIVYDFAYLPQLPIEPWDIRLDYICTETIIERSDR